MRHVLLLLLIATARIRLHPMLRTAPSMLPAR